MTADERAVKEAFEEMKRTEMALDDMDYLTNSPRLQKAMEAAESFRKALEQADARKRIEGMRRTQ